MGVVACGYAAAACFEGGLQQTWELPINADTIRIKGMYLPLTVHRREREACAELRQVASKTLI